MVKAALFALACACHQNAPPATPKLTATVQETKGSDGKPAFIVEGTAGYPDGVRLEINLYFEHAFGRHLAPAATIVTDGRFAEPIQLRWARNIAGTYLARVEFNPHLQGGAHTRLPKAKPVDATLRVGTVADAQKARQEWREHLLGVLKEDAAIMTEVQDFFKANKGTPGSEAWRSKVEEWNKRVLEIQSRAYKTKEYNLYADLNHISVDGLHLLSDFVRHMAHHASKGNEEAVTLAKEKIAQTIAGFERTLTKAEYTPGDLQELAKEARRQLKEVAEARGDSAAETRSRFKLTLLSLGGNSTGDARETVMGLLAETAAWFKELDAGAPGAAKRREELDLRIEELQDDLKPQK